MLLVLRSEINKLRMKKNERNKKEICQYLFNCFRCRIKEIFNRYQKKKESKMNL